MSFSANVKEELAKQLPPARHCRIAELAAILSVSGRILPENEKAVLAIQTENETVMKKCFTLLKKTFNISKEVIVRKSNLKRGHVYSLVIEDPGYIKKILQTTKLSVEGLSQSGQLLLANPVVIQNTCCKRAFLRGIFLASGSISDPEKGYHLEIVSSSAGKAEQIREVMQAFSLDGKIVMRKKSFVTYLKEGEQIVDALAVMEANVALMNLENVRIVKDMRNTVNRKVNCETANINKTVNAAIRQIEDIEYIRSEIGLGELKEGLEEIARLRLQYPEASLKELGEMLSHPVGKSGVNHRLRKLSGLAEDLRESRRSTL